jgi:hypothetical protein
MTISQSSNATTIPPKFGIPTVVASWHHKSTVDCKTEQTMLKSSNIEFLFMRLLEEKNYGIVRLSNLWRMADERSSGRECGSRGSFGNPGRACVAIELMVWGDFEL